MRLRTHLAPALLTALWITALVCCYAGCFDPPPFTYGEPTIQTTSPAIDQAPRLYLTRRMMVKRWTVAGGTFCSGPNG